MRKWKRRGEMTANWSLIGCIELNSNFTTCLWYFLMTSQGSSNGSYLCTITVRLLKTLMCLFFCNIVLRFLHIFFLSEIVFGYFFFFLLSSTVDFLLNLHPRFPLISTVVTNNDKQFGHPFYFIGWLRFHLSRYDPYKQEQCWSCQDMSMGTKMV